jgi:hypothetical protein
MYEYEGSSSCQGTPPKEKTKKKPDRIRKEKGKETL